MSSGNFREAVAVVVGTSGTRARRRPALVAAVVLLLSALAWYAGPAEAVNAQATVDLTSDTGTDALFDGSRPLGIAHPQSACLTVGSTGAVAGDTVSIAAVEVSGALADALQLTVEMGTGGGGGSCTGFSGTTVWSGTLTDLASAPGDGIDTGWEPASTSSRTFRISAVIAAGSTVAGGTSASGKFAWRLVPSAVPPPVTPTPTTTSPTPTTTSPAPTTTSVPPTTATPTPTTTSHSTTRTTTTSHPVTTTTPHPTSSTVTNTPATASPPQSPTPIDTPTPDATPTSHPSGTLDNSVPTTPATPTKPGPHPSSTLSSTTSHAGGGSGGGTDVVLGAVTSVKAVPAKVGKALGSLVSSSLSPLLGAESAERAGETVAAVIASPQYPLVVIVLAVLFLLVQYRIDARDPKLAAAQVRQRDNELQFPDLFGARAALARRLPWLLRGAPAGVPAGGPADGTGPQLVTSMPDAADSAPRARRRWAPWRR